MAERDLPCQCSHHRCSVTSALRWNASSPVPPPRPKCTSTSRVKKSAAPNLREGLPVTGGANQSGRAPRSNQRRGGLHMEGSTFPNWTGTDLTAALSEILRSVVRDEPQGCARPSSAAGARARRRAAPPASEGRPAARLDCESFAKPRRARIRRRCPPCGREMARAGRRCRRERWERLLAAFSSRRLDEPTPSAARDRNGNHCCLRARVYVQCPCIREEAAKWPAS